MKYEFFPKGVCSMKMVFNIEDNIVKELDIIGGCPGNTVGVSKLVKGRSVDEIIQMLKGIPCGSKKTSCPDQIAMALTKYKKINDIRYLGLK